MIPKEIIHNYSLKEFKNNWLIGEIQLPSRTITHFMKEDETSNFVFSTTIQNFYDIEIFAIYLNLIDEIIERKELDFKQLNRLEFKKINSFENIIFAPFEFTLTPNSYIDGFDERLIKIFPTYCFEMNGTESKDEVKSIFKNILNYTDWNREPSPLVRYKFNNPKHQYWTRGKNLVIGPETNVYSALKNFESSDCLMEVKNSLDEFIKINFSEEENVFMFDNIKLNLDDIVKHLELFFRKCN